YTTTLTYKKITRCRRPATGRSKRRVLNNERMLIGDSPECFRMTQRWGRRCRRRLDILDVVLSRKDILNHSLCPVFRRNPLTYARH
ncbi:unnamed protein product, partial [Nesidiocoris tenuis]